MQSIRTPYTWEIIEGGGEWGWVFFKKQMLLYNVEDYFGRIVRMACLRDWDAICEM